MNQHYYLSHCYTIAWDRIYDQLSPRVSARSVCLCICSHSRSCNYERILTKFGTGVDNRNGQDEFVSGENRKMVRGPGRSVYPQNISNTARDREIPAKSKKMNISETVKDSDKLTQNHSYKIACTLSESASTLELRRHLAEKSA